MKPKIAYLMSRFPHLSETFILREMTALEGDGWPIALYPLVVQKQAVIHSDAKPWLSRIRDIPFMSWPGIVSNLQALFQQPNHYCYTLLRTIWENRTNAKFLLRSIALFPKAVQMAYEMQRENITHVHAHYASHPALAAWIIHRLTGMGYSVTVHAHDIFVRQEMLATKLSDATFIVAISEFNRDYLSQRIGPWLADKTHVVHCGIVPDTYNLASTDNYPSDKFEVISIGSLQDYKGQEYLIKACAILRDNAISLRCRIIGGGEEQQTLENLIAEYALEDVVTLLGPQPQEVVADLLPTAQCYVQPSIITPSGKMEGIPVSLMEALACGLPVIATAISGIPELVRPDETGYLVPPGDAVALASAMTTVRENANKASKLALAGRTLVHEAFNLHQNAKQLSALFEGVN